MNHQFMEFLRSCYPIKCERSVLMSLLTAASGKSVYRGYDYYENDNVSRYTQISDTEIEGFVKGTMPEPYKVHLNLSKVRSSTCDCPFATGNKICKHMVAVFFAAYPDEARKYKAELDARYEEEEEREAEFDNMLQQYINKLSKSELQEALLQLLYDGPEWQLEKFINDYIE